ncbi:conserved hypothetical protein [Burkholderiales bacterium 8X]|nr:conserved hypothetical protein [Burkholderiales bacterium 8X]
MTFTTTLFKALSTADLTQCNGQKVEARMLDESPSALLKPYVDLADRSTVYIEDQEIQVDDEGRAYCRAKADAKSEPLVWIFRVLGPLKSIHMPDEPLTVADLRRVMGASNGSAKRSA